MQRNIAILFLAAPLLACKAVESGPSVWGCEQHVLDIASDEPSRAGFSADDAMNLMDGMFSLRPTPLHATWEENEAGRVGDDFLFDFAQGEGPIQDISETFHDDGCDHGLFLVLPLVASLGLGDSARWEGTGHLRVYNLEPADIVVHLDLNEAEIEASFRMQLEQDLNLISGTSGVRTLEQTEVDLDGNLATAEFQDITLGASWISENARGNATIYGGSFSISEGLNR